MTPLSWVLVLAIAGGGLWLLARRVKRSMLQPGKIQAAIHARYQELLAKRRLDPLRSHDVDFVFSASTSQVATLLHERLESAGWRVSINQEADEWLIEAVRELPSAKINFVESQELFAREAAAVGAKYVGPGAKGLALVGINLPQLGLIDAASERR